MRPYEELVTVRWEQVEATSYLPSEVHGSMTARCLNKLRVFATER